MPQKQLHSFYSHRIRIVSIRLCVECFNISLLSSSSSRSSFSGSFVSPSRISLIESQKREKRKVKRNLRPFYMLFSLYKPTSHTHTQTNRLLLSPPTFFVPVSIQTQLYQSRRQIHEVESILFVTFCKKYFGDVFKLSDRDYWFVTWIALYLLIIDIHLIHTHTHNRRIIFFVVYLCV